MAKRRAEKQLLKEDVDKSDEEDSAGEYTKADDAEISRRVIKVAKRRNLDSTDKPSPFSGFAGFNTPAGSAPSKIGQKIDFTKDANSTSKSETSANDSREMDALKSLNMSFISWIQQHLDKNPYVILLPVFRDYEKHLSKLKFGPSKPTIQSMSNTSNISKTEAKTAPSTASLNFNFGAKANSENKTASSTTLPSFSFATKTNSENKTTAPSINFNFGKTSNSEVSAFKPSDTVDSSEKSKSNAVSSTTFPSFQFAKKDPVPLKDTKATEALSSGKSESKLTSSVSSTTFTSNLGGIAAFNNGISPWQKLGETKPGPFGGSTQQNIGAGFFSNKTPAASEQSEQQEETSDEPPQTNFVPVGEDDSVFDIRCKVFLKKSDGFSSIGVGTLYLKTVGENKTQLIVRADTAQGSVLLNFLLSADLPIQSTGKNNVLVVSIPTPEAKPPPVPVLIRVKNGEERDKLYKELKRLSGS